MILTTEKTIEIKAISRPSILLLTDNPIHRKTNKIISEALESGYSITVISCLEGEPYESKSVQYVYVKNSQYQESLFEKLDDIDVVLYNGNWSKNVATLLKERGVKVLDDVECLPNGGKERLLLRSFDGIGDQLMLIPTIKTHVEKYGREIDLYVQHADVFKNLPYIRKIYEYEEQINRKKYLAYYDTSWKLSSYAEEYCRQHRIKATAECCGLKGKDLIIDKPEIILTDNEKMAGEKLLGRIERVNTRNKIVLGLFSNDKKRAYPMNRIQPLIASLNESFNSTDVVLVGDKREEYEGAINLTGKTNLRELFSVIYNSDVVITIDSSVVHIAGAFDKPTVFLPSTILGEWRTYKNTKIIKPKTQCYPCNELIRKHLHPNFCYTEKQRYSNCLETIGIEEIVEETRKKLEEITEEKIEC